MSKTMQQVVDLARIALSDSKKARYSDAVLLGYLNSGLYRIFEVRPDLRFGQYATPFSDLTLGESFPLADRFAQTAADYVSGRAQLKNDDAGNQARAQTLLQMFAAELIA